MPASDHVVLQRSAVSEPRAVVLCEPDGFVTPWRRWQYIELPSGESLRAEETAAEQALVVLQGGVKIQQVGDLEVGDLVLCNEFSALNKKDEQADLLHVAVGTDTTTAPRTPTRETVDATKLSWRPALHGGVGRIATRHVWGPEDFSSTFTFLDHAILEAGGSVGYHFHEALEESFFILKGRALMTIDDRTFEVAPDSATWQGIGQGHGIFNPYGDDLEFLRIAVAQAGEVVSTIDLHDNLAGRTAGSE
jgi:mannose-6-phosphate isomerase-like protein (cupin superfamily)